MPIRKSGNDGYLPAEGWRADDDWTGDYVPFQGLPSVLDPDEGFVVTANQAVTDRDYPYLLNNDDDPFLPLGLPSFGDGFADVGGHDGASGG